MNSIDLKKWLSGVVFLSAILAIGCTRAKTSPSLTTEQSTATINSVRAFAATVADDVTRRGPIAWHDHFTESPNFFMASEGRLVFANGDAALRGINSLTGSIAHLELRWGEPMIVDPLTPTLAMLAAPYHEVLIDPSGHKIEESGYFTGLAELGSSGWKFRNAHWSVIPSPSPAP